MTAPLTARADVATDAPERYAKQLVAHLGRRVEFSTEGGRSTARFGAFVLFLAAAITDWFDGYLARTRKQETDLGRIKPGMEVAIRIDTPGTPLFKGRIGFISPPAEFTPKNVQTRDERVKLVYKVKIALENADGLFKPGMPAEVRLDPAPAEAAARP